MATLLVRLRGSIGTLSALQVAALVLMVATVATRLWQDHLWLGWLIAGAAVLVWAPSLPKVQARRWWFVYVAGTFIYTLLRSYADETAIPVRFDYVISTDRVLLLGADPIRWLQAPFFEPGNIQFLDIAATAVHWSFFVVPHAAAVAIFVWRRPLFGRYITTMVGTLYLGLLLFFLVPTAPPWLAAQTGDLNQVFRVMDFVGGSIDDGAYSAAYRSLGEPNSVAAMPSIHMAVTFALYLWAREHYHRAAPWLLVYSIVMGLSLMYLAEHYATDLLAGVLVAFVAHRAARRFVPAYHGHAAR